MLSTRLSIQTLLRRFLLLFAWKKRETPRRTCILRCLKTLHEHANKNRANIKHELDKIVKLTEKAKDVQNLAEMYPEYSDQLPTIYNDIRRTTGSLNIICSCIKVATMFQEDKNFLFLTDHDEEQRIFSVIEVAINVMPDDLIVTENIGDNYNIKEVMEEYLVSIKKMI